MTDRTHDQAAQGNTPAPQPGIPDVPPISPDELDLLRRSVTEDLNTLLDGGQL